ncbi:hypothetical protein [Ruminococcus sp.]|uniref:ATP-binding protein n=1 Tax=Ruminococcus sp. TaxID=41978 RepID=UPI001B3CA4D2|nr:hypothetical protein [Ruminococcus sp.]MBP5432984.1 hypothetical protein [Ruminococcus sp.]
MFEELKGKRLLVLGGTAWADIIFNFADENDIHLLTTGKNPNKMFDEYYYVDSTDNEGMKTLIREKNIDGVYVGSHEGVIRHATKYLAELGLPCYCTFQQWDNLMNKRKFKELCQKFDIPVAPKYEWFPETPCEIQFPVIVKPADGCASVGIKICHNEAELREGYQLAYDNSDTHEVLIEKLVNNTGMDVFFQITNSQIEFCGLGDKYPVQLAEGAGAVAGARILPSIYTEDFRDRFENKIKDMLSSVKLTQGLIWMEVFHDGNNYYFNEVGYRPNGSLTIVGIDYFYGINTVAADIYFALTGKGKAKGFNSLILKAHSTDKKKVCEYWIACHPGTIKEIQGIDEVKAHPNVLAAFPKYSVDSIIPHTNGFAQNFCVVHFAYNNASELQDVIKYIKSTVKVIDIKDDDMIIHKTNDFINTLIMDN